MNEYKRIVAEYLGITVGEIVYYGSEGFTNGLGEIVAQVTVIIDQKMRYFWINTATEVTREFTWDRER